MDALVVLAVFSVLAVVGFSQPTNDAAVMQELKKSLNSPSQLGWTDAEPCKWNHVHCSNRRVIRIQIGGQNLTGSLPQSLNGLTSLQIFEAQNNGFGGPLPSFSGLSSLQRILLNGNEFTSVPQDFFNGLTSLDTVFLDGNPFASWRIDIIQNATGLKTFSANSANISGPLPNIFDKLTGLTFLHLAFNYLEGPLPPSFAGSSISTLWLNSQQSVSKLNGSVAILQNMTQLGEVWLHDNLFSGPLPDFTGFTALQNFSVRNNQLTGPVPDSLVGLPALKTVNLTSNLFQGRTPLFSRSVQVDLVQGTESFCIPDPGVECDQRVTVLLNVVAAFGYPVTLAQSWKGNDPCANAWKGVTCNRNGDVTVLSLNGMGLSGTMSPNISMITSLQTLILSNNQLTGTIPNELTTLPNLVTLDVSNNQLYGKVPAFKSNVKVNTAGNVNIGKDVPPPGTPGSPGSPSDGESNGKSSSGGKITGLVIGVVVVLVLVLVFGFFIYRKKHKLSGAPFAKVTHPGHSDSEDAIKIGIVNGDSSPSDLHFVEASNLVISIEVLRNVTDNFSERNILGKGGFGTVYKGELHDGTKIAVKRMEVSVMNDKGLEEFKSEISVLTKVRHRHLVALLGYCLDGKEKLLVYEYMPQGTLSRFLFGWKVEGLKPLEWMKRLIIALDVARGVEYLHSLAQQSFIHRDLKPSNILLGDDMRAKVADFGLVRLAPDGKASIATKLAGTFGYLAPEYAVTGKVTTKIDVYSFGVILMEIITGRKALDESLHEDSQHLVPRFRRMLINKDTFHKAIDPFIELDEGTLPSIMTVAELAGHCTARDPHQRPDMGHAVNVLSSLAEIWKPAETHNQDDYYGVDFDMSLSQAVKRWQAMEGMSGTAGPSFIGNSGSTHDSLPTRPSGFATTFSNSDGR